MKMVNTKSLWTGGANLRDAEDRGSIQAEERLWQV